MTELILAAVLASGWTGICIGVGIWLSKYASKPGLWPVQYRAQPVLPKDPTIEHFKAEQDALAKLVTQPFEHVAGKRNLSEAVRQEVGRGDAFQR